jgi:hypothetical protein
MFVCVFVCLLHTLVSVLGGFTGIGCALIGLDPVHLVNNLTGSEFFAVVAPLENLRAYPRSATLEISKGGQTLLTRPMVETVRVVLRGASSP